MSEPTPENVTARAAAASVPALRREVATVLCILLAPLLAATAATLIDAEMEWSSLADSLTLLGWSVSAIALIALVRDRAHDRSGFGVRGGLRTSDSVIVMLVAAGWIAASWLVDRAATLLPPSTHDSLLWWGRGTFAMPEVGLEVACALVAYASAAFAEELVFRGWLIGRLETILGSSRSAVLASSALFASYHAYQGLVGVASTFAMGVVSAVVFLGVRRVWPIALAHFAWNVHAVFPWPLGAWIALGCVFVPLASALVRRPGAPAGR